MGWGDTQQSLKKRDLRNLRSLIQARRSQSTQETQPSDRPVWDAAHRQYCVHLSRASRISGIDLPEGSEVYYTPQGRLASILLSEAATVVNQEFPAASMIHLYADGNLDWISLGHETLIHSATSDLPPMCVMRQISYYRNGQIKEVMLARPSILQDHVLGANTIVHFSNDGQLVWAQLSRSTSFVMGDQTLSAAAQSCVEFHRNGKVRCLTLAQATQLQGHRFDPNVQVKFDPEGHLAMAAIAPPQEHPHISHNTVLRFERDGRIKEITVS